MDNDDDNHGRGPQSKEHNGNTRATMHKMDEDEMAEERSGVSIKAAPQPPCAGNVMQLNSLTKLPRRSSDFCSNAPMSPMTTRGVGTGFEPGPRYRDLVIASA